MSKATHNELGWEVLAQPTGEVLTAEARSPGLLLGLLGVPQGFEARDAEGWLYDVAGVSHESTAARPTTRPIPALLDHALTGLLFSHAELWEHPGNPLPCSFAFAEGRGEIGFGWVGDAKVSVWVDGEPRSGGFVSLRDGQGRSGHAWSIPSYHNIQVRISWRSSASDPTSPGAEVEASWIADGRSAPGYHPVPVHGEQAVEFQPEAEVRNREPEVREFVADDYAEEAPEPGHEPTLNPEPIPLVTAVVADAGPVARRRGGFWARIRSLFGLVDHGDKEMDEEEVWRVAAEEHVDVVATGTDDAIGFSIEVPTSAGPSLQLADRTSSGSRHDVTGIGPSMHLLERQPVEIEEGVSPPFDHQVVGTESMAGRSIDREAIETEPSLLFERDEVGIDAEVSPPAEHEVARIETDSLSPPPASEAVASEGDASLEISPTPEPFELTERAPEWAPAEDPHAIDLPSLEPSARLAHNQDAWRDIHLELARIARDETPAASQPASGPISETFPSEDDAAWAPQSAAEEELPETTLVAESPGASTPSGALPSSWEAISPQHPAWPSPQELARTRRPPIVPHLWRWVALVVALFAGGWLVGGLQDDGRARDASHRGRLGDALHAVGLGGPRYLVQVNSRPPGAWITVDGQPLALRTPAAIEAAPGGHVVGLSFSEFGSAGFRVEGRKGDHIPLDAALWGALEIVSPEEIGVISVAVDGVPRGFAPLRVDSLAPGIHELRFSAPGMEPWGQTVEIRVRETRKLMSRAVPPPSSGVLEVQASITDETGNQPLKGAQVFIDGEARGVTPLTVDLPRGPHSVRLSYKGQNAPIQVIDLPGGNQRFAVFELGVETDAPHLTIDVPARIPRDRPAVLSATLVGVAPAELREMWLHVQMPDDTWGRYPMTLLKGPAGAAGVVTFPPAAFNAQGRGRYYVSAQSNPGEESFTEMRSISMEPATRR